MKKIIYSILAVVAVFATSSCEKNLDIPQKGVTAIENFYLTDDDAEQAMVAAYAGFVSYVCSFNGGTATFAPLRFAFNLPADDVYAAGEFYGDNDFAGQLNEFRYDSDNTVVVSAYKNFYLAMYPVNLVIDHFKDGLPEGGQTATTKRVVAEARVLRAYLHMMLAIGWNNPPFVDHVLAGSDLPYNCDTDPENPMTHNELLEWCAKECDEAAADLLERTSTADKDGAAKVRKGFAYSVAGKALLFAGKYAEAKAEFQKVIDSQKYALIPTERYAENFHIEGDCNEEKIFEGNIEDRSGDVWGTGLMGRTTWMEANIWGWRGDHFIVNPVGAYTSIDGWGGCGVPVWFSKAMLENDGQSARFQTCFMPIDKLIYETKYGIAEIDDMTIDQKKASKKVGIEKPLYGESYYLPYKQLVAIRDLRNPGENVRVNNFTIMRYAEVLLMQAECCLQTGDAAGAKKYINMIQERAGSKTISATVDMNVLKAEKSYEMWLEGCRWPDMVRWGDFARAKDAGKTVPVMYDKLFRAPEAGDENVQWQDPDKRFYTVDTHGAQSQGIDPGFKEGKHEYFPFPGSDVIAKNPNITQNKGW